MTAALSQATPRSVLARFSGRRGALVAFVVLAVALVVLIVTMTPWTVQSAPPGGRTPVDAGRDFTATQISTENAYHGSVQPWSYTSLVLGLVVSGILGLTPLGARLIRAVARPLGGGWVWQVLLGSITLAVIGQLVALPFAIHNEQVRRDYGLSTHDWGTWTVDVAKGLGVGVVLSSVALLGFYTIVRKAPRTWWMWTAAGGAALVIGVSFAYPVVIEPVFNKFQSMPDGPLRTSLLEMARRDGVPVSDVLVADASRRTTSQNAYVSGFGSTRRIVVYDTMLRDSTPDNVRLVVAHELGHAKRNDVLHGTLIGALAVATACCLAYLLMTWPRLVRRSGTDSVRDPRSMALLLFLLAVGGLLAAPVQSVVSRHVEARADLHALDLTGEPAQFREMQVDLARANLSDLDPNPVAYFMFAGHPTAPERIAMARDWAREHGQRVP